MSKYLFCLVFFIAGCFEAPRKITFEDSDSLSASSGGDSSDVQADTEDSSSSNKATLFTTDLHSARFQVAAPQVQPLDCPGDIKIPVLSYMLPAESDYLEILRCRDSLNLTGTLGRSLQEVLSMPTTELQVEMQTSHFFQQALDSKQCVMVAHAFKQHLTFTDYTAPNKGVYYLIRACVTLDRIRDREVAGIESCSRWVARSPVWEHENPATREDLQRLEQAQSKQIAMEKSYHTLYNLASGIFDALNACDVKEEERQIADHKKKAINMLVSLGVGAVAGLATGKNLLKTGDALSGSLSSVLNDLTTKPEDFPRSCYDAYQKYRIFLVEVERYKDHSRAYKKALSSKPSVSC